MRKRMGIIIFVSGVLLYIKPQINREYLFVAFLAYLQEYWPLLLVFVGINLMNKKKIHRKK